MDRAGWCQSEPARILLVEDDPIQREVLAASLDAHGYVVETAANGLDAVWMIQEGQHDLVLLDYELPEIDGLGVARLVGELGGPASRPPMLALTGRPDSLRSRAALSESGFAGIVGKPITVPGLLATIEHQLAADTGRAARQAARIAQLERRWAEYGVPSNRPEGGDLPAAARILIVEDDPLQRSVLQSVVERHGHTVEVAADGFEAVRRIRAQPFDLVLLDYLLPEMDGLAVGRVILDLMHDDVRPCLLALTAARDHLTARQTETGSAFDEILVKSSDHRSLLASIDRHLRSSPNRATRQTARLSAGLPSA